MICASPPVRLACSDIGRAEWVCRSVEDLGSVLSLLSAPSSESTAACTKRSVAACREGSKPCKDKGTEKVHAEGAALKDSGRVASESRRAVQSTDTGLFTGLNTDRLDDRCADGTPEELWQTRLSLLSDHPNSLPLAIAAPQDFTGDGWEETECEAVETSASSASGAALSSDLLEHEKLWHCRLSLYFDSREREAWCSPIAASPSANRVDSVDLDLDTEVLMKDLARWLSLEQMKTLGMQITDSTRADLTKSRPEAKHRYSLGRAITTAVLTLVSFLISSACGIYELANSKLVVTMTSMVTAAANANS